MSLEINDLDRPIRGAKRIGEILGLPPRQVYYGLEKGLYDADKLGRLWVTTPRRLLNQFAGRKPAEASAA